MNKLLKKCKCGKEFETFDYRVKDGRGKFCSKKCQYANAYRPSGLKYKIVTINRGWFKKGDKPWHTGLKGILKANRGSFKKGEHRSIETEFKEGEKLGNNNNNWKGDEVGYFALHAWINRNFGLPNKCEECDSIKNVEWANINYIYNRDKINWKCLCRRCHFKYDSKNNWGYVTRKFHFKRSRLCQKSVAY